MKNMTEAEAKRKAGIKARYLTLRNEGHEFYAENLEINFASVKQFKELAMARLLAARQAMPKGDVSVLVYQENSDGRTYSFNPETGAMAEVL